MKRWKKKVFVARRDRWPAIPRGVSSRAQRKESSIRASGEARRLTPYPSPWPAADGKIASCVDEDCKVTHFISAATRLGNAKRFYLMHIKYTLSQEVGIAPLRLIWCTTSCREGVLRHNAFYGQKGKVKLRCKKGGASYLVTWCKFKHETWQWLMLGPSWGDRPLIIFYWPFY